MLLSIPGKESCCIVLEWLDTQVKFNEQDSREIKIALIIFPL